MLLIMSILPFQLRDGTLKKSRTYWLYFNYTFDPYSRVVGYNATKEFHLFDISATEDSQDPQDTTKNDTNF